MRVQFFEARPYEEPEAFPIDYAGGDIGGGFGQKVHQPIGLGAITGAATTASGAAGSGEAWAKAPRARRDVRARCAGT
jgi:hypothetical protein